VLERVLEPEVMDCVDEAIDYNQMDHGAVNRQFVDDLLAVGPVGDEVLDLGTGTALIPIELCERDLAARVLAVDLAEAMLDVARLNVEMACQMERILLDRADSKQLPYDDGRFTAVISNSIVHHVPHPAAVLGEAIRVCRTGGLLFFRDLARPASDQQVRHLVETYAGDEADHARAMFEASLRAALTVDEVRALVAPLGFDPAGVRMTSDRHWTWAARRPSA